MATLTANFTFYCPGRFDGALNGRPWGAKINKNFADIDTILKAHADALAALGGDVAGIVGVPAFTSADIGKSLQILAGPVLGWATPTGGGGSGGTAAYTLWDPDCPPASPHALSDEFNGGPTLDPKWVTINWGTPAAKDVNSTIHGALYVYISASSGYTVPAISQPLPAGDFTLWLKLNAQSDATSASNAGGGLFLSDGTTAGSGNQVILQQVTSGATWLYRWTGFNSVGSQVWLRTEPAQYLRIRRSGSTYYWATSKDGELWGETAFNPAFTPTHFGISCYNNQGGKGWLSYEYIRYDPSATAVLGAAVQVNLPA